MSLPDGEAEQWLVHPAILDLATAVAVGLTPDDDDALYVPVRYGRVTSFAPLPRDVTVRAHAARVRRPGPRRHHGQPTKTASSRC